MIFDPIVNIIDILVFFHIKTGSGVFEIWSWKTVRVVSNGWYLVTSGCIESCICKLGKRCLLLINFSNLVLLNLIFVVIFLSIFWVLIIGQIIFICFQVDKFWLRHLFIKHIVIIWIRMLSCTFSFWWFFAQIVFIDIMWAWLFVLVHFNFL